MPERPDTLVFVPAWNEEESLPAVLEELRAVLPDADVLVVDDGSTDRTAELARAGGAGVLSLGANRGLPAAISAGYGYARDRGYAYCGRVDADGQHPAGELRRLLERVRAGVCDVAVGSRFAAGRAIRSTATAGRASESSASSSCGGSSGTGSRGPCSTPRAASTRSTSVRYPCSPSRTRLALRR